ncbi:hypothetical protein [Paenibacillus sp.]
MMHGDHTRKILLPDGTALPAIGQGTWNMGEAIQPGRRSTGTAFRY